MLNFEKLEIHGFKSFADKVSIPFTEGITAIIGPNGCGKSNVSDAIRWGLGEMSAKQLRGKSMHEVIFAGTEKRRSMSYCEVTLVFNNEDRHVFPKLALDEVSVTRKMDRGGGSEYYINNNRCRRGDIVDLFSDTGLGKEGYSIIGQGKVAEIMSAKPDDRRNIFEEAAEIISYRNDCRDAERKLEKAKANLQIANEVIAELEKQLVPMRKQAETAEKYFELREQLKLSEVNFYIYNYENAQSIKQGINDKLERAKLELEKKELELKEAIRRYDECISTSAGIDRLYDENSRELLALKVAATKMEGDAAIVKERITNIQNEIARLNNELNALDSQLIVTDQLIKGAEEKRDSKFAEYLAMSESASALEAKFKELTLSVEGQEQDIETRNREYLQAIEELSSLKANYTSYLAEKSINDERLKNLQALLSDKKEKLNEDETNLSIYNGKIKNIKETMRQSVEEYNETLSQKNSALEAKKEYDADIVKLNAHLGTAQGMLQIHTSIKEQYTGYQEAVKLLMQDAKADPVLAKRVWGVLAEVIKVPPEFITAIDYALGGSVQHVLCETEQDAAYLINYLKNKGYGRITFRPYTSCRPHPLSGDQLAVLKEPGCRGLASDLVTYDKKFDPFIQALLGSTVIVNNLDIANHLFRKYNQGFRIVTLAGEIFTRAGEITGGSKRSQAQSLLAQDQNIETARLNVEKYKNNIATLRARLADNEQEIAECDEKMQKLTANMSELRIELGLNESKAKQASDSIELLNAEIIDAATEYEKTKAIVADIEAKINSIDRLEKLASEKKDEFTALFEESKSQGSQQRSERETLQSELVQTRVSLASLSGEIDTAKSNISLYTRQRTELEDDKIETVAALKSKQEELERVAVVSENAVISPEDAARINELEKDIDMLSERKLSIAEEIKSCDDKKTELSEARNDLSGKMIRYEGMLDNVDIEIRNQQNHILEEYDLTYATALQFKQEDFDEKAAPGVINDLKRAIGRLGDVNPLALQNLKDAETRLDEQVVQRDDIQKACDDIQRIIDNLYSIMRDKFTVAFDKINENFKVVFRQLFGGGKGELRLNATESDDVLEQGIDIFAQPPGKKLQNIGLLSGGEQALTAISILFAILKLKPMPFCVLDEIDAALDDANVNLFAEFLKQFSDYTQFIVITHRKPTMRHADTIFGVTMEEKGVTKLVSIEFAEAEKQAQ